MEVMKKVKKLVLVVFVLIFLGNTSHVFANEGFGKDQFEIESYGEFGTLIKERLGQPPSPEESGGGIYLVALPANYISKVEIKKIYTDEMWYPESIRKELNMMETDEKGDTVLNGKELNNEMWFPDPKRGPDEWSNDEKKCVNILTTIHVDGPYELPCTLPKLGWVGDEILDFPSKKWVTLRKETPKVKDSIVWVPIHVKDKELAEVKNDEIVLWDKPDSIPHEWKVATYSNNDMILPNEMEGSKWWDDFIDRLLSGE